MKFSYNLITGLILVMISSSIHGQESGCDYNLTVSDVACWAGEYTFPDGTVATNIISQVVHTSNLETVHTSCDSIITTTVDPLPFNYRTEDLYGFCPGVTYTFPDGTVDTIWAHTEYTSYLQTAHTGCDSIVETILNTTDMNLNVSVSGNQLMSQQGNAGYQWVDCDDNYSHINGQGNQLFIAPVGNFAVIIYKGSCTDTSDCHQVLTVDVNETNLEQVAIYPNPSTGQFNVNLGIQQPHVVVTIKNVLGQIIETQILENVHQFDMTIKGETGLYFVELVGVNGLNATYHVLIE